MGAQPLGSKKRGLMDRLRQARPSSAKARPGQRGRHGGLDMEELDTKLEHHAAILRHPGWHATLRRGQAGPVSTDDDDDDDDDGPDGVGPLDQQQKQQKQKQQVAGNQPAPGPSSDYEAFLREAEEDDRRRAPERRGHGPAARGRKLPLNSFYSNNWAAGSEPLPPPVEKLPGIQESGPGPHDGGGGGSDSGGGGGSSSSSKGTSPGGTGAVRGGSSHGAPRRPSPPRAHTDPCGGGGSGVQGSRRVQFSSGTGEVGERLGGRRGSGASCNRMKSPPRPVRRQRSMMRVIADYIRPPRD
ncbi:hypothetical protein VSDG_00592 [Cytospora chrysosperma]|uniref:Uncharacterized protein n=1 Tax=Cytospora chrysosperma TaxID=252740 RepID=A0A423WPF3_CYTCH|nr:hypothetical protein VSDG_00592 [Valsa sordida]